MHVTRIALALSLVACSQPAKPRDRSHDPELGSDAERFNPALVVPGATVDAAPPSQDEKLAAIQKAMNELDEASQACWAMAATDRFDIEGDVTMMVEIGNATAKASVVSDTARNTKLSDCLVKLLGGYAWAPPLVGETIQLPFKFKAPDGQSVIDRTLVEWHGQQNTSVAVLLDENNTGNSAASMLEVAIAPRGSTGMRVAERSELWYFLGEVEVKSSQGKGDSQFHLNAMPGTMMFVPKGAAREVIARRPDVHAVVVVVPGGREGSARAGALPTTMQDRGTGAPMPLLVGTPYGPVSLFLDPSVVKTAPMSASVLELAGDVRVPEHIHAGETELLYVLEGRATLTIAGQDITLEPTSVVQIPPNTKHALRTNAKFRALQIYTPPGPEQRFKKKTS